MRNSHFIFVFKNRGVHVCLFLILSLTLFSCKDKLDLIGDGNETAVIYALLDPLETTHYVKITKSFIGDGFSNSLDIAKIPDSSYFNQVNARIEERLPNGQLGRTFILKDTLITNKDTKGVFYAPQQKVYVFYTPQNLPLVNDATYHLFVDIDGGRIKITGQTRLVTGMTLGNWINSNMPLRLTRSGNELGTYANHTLALTNVGNAYRLNAKVRFDYREYSATSNDSTDHSILFSLGDMPVRLGINASNSFSFSGEQFYRTLQREIPPLNSSVLKRVHKGFEIQITGASLELSNYMDVTRPSSSLAQNKPQYTNMTANEGYKVVGIFAARTTLSIYKDARAASAAVQALDKKSRRELCAGPLTANLGFCSDHPADNITTSPESWSCP